MKDGETFEVKEEVFNEKMRLLVLGSIIYVILSAVFYQLCRLWTEKEGKRLVHFICSQVLAVATIHMAVTPLLRIVCHSVHTQSPSAGSAVWLEVIDLLDESFQIGLLMTLWLFLPFTYFYSESIGFGSGWLAHFNEALLQLALLLGFLAILWFTFLPS